MVKHAVVLGAGVSGLSTALLLQMEGIKVTIVSRASPELKNYDIDEFYASREAGAHWCSFAKHEDLELQRMEMKTLDMFVKLALLYPHQTGIKRMKSKCLFKSSTAVEPPWYASHVPSVGFCGDKWLEKSELPVVASSGFEYETVTINTGKYLRWLLFRFKALGGVLQILSISNITSDLLRFHPDIIVNCSGYGSRYLGGVEDKSVIPVRGQTVLVRTDGSHEFTITRFPAASERVTAYIIPRDDGTILLGGTFEANTEDTRPDPIIAKEIIERCKEISPGFALMMDTGNTDIIRHGVGIRPFRKEGIRIEVETIENVPVVHNYGHGSYGYQSSWGSAEKAVQLVMKTIQQDSKL